MSSRATSGRRGTRRRKTIGCSGVAVLLVLAAVGIGALLGNDGADAADPDRETTTQAMPKGTASAGPSDATEVELIRVTDGDTIVTSAGTVRLIGIDTPERGECGYRDAALAIETLAPAGANLLLTAPPGQRDRDRHGRLLRSASTADGIDLGRAQIDEGHAVARYDSRDGYPSHPEENAYHEAQRAVLTSEGDVITVACGATSQSSAGSGVAEAGAAESGGTGAEAGAGAGAADTGAEGQTSTTSPPAATGGDSWFLAYPSCAALKRNTVGDPIGPFFRDDPAQAEAYRWFQDGTGHRGDGDGDGWACE